EDCTAGRNASPETTGPPDEGRAPCLSDAAARTLHLPGTTLFVWFAMAFFPGRSAAGGACWITRLGVTGRNAVAFGSKSGGARARAIMARSSWRAGREAG